jgi:hypothetical protein
VFRHSPQESKKEDSLRGTLRLQAKGIRPSAHPVLKEKRNVIWGVPPDTPGTSLIKSGKK